MQSDRQRRDLARSLSWPPPPIGPHAPNIYKTTTPTTTSFEDDLDNNPENYFLSPMYEYEDWAEDSDSDGEEVEWTAGITDFTLFDEDRRRAQQDNKPLPSKWNGMLASQASALQRSVQRERAASDPATRPLHESDNEVPNLTPDTSPDLRDDLDVESYHGQTVERPRVPNYLTIAVTPPKQNESAVEDEDLPFSVWVARKQMQGKQVRRIQRPGMRHSRTMSGKIHAWTRPSREMYTVGEDAQGEDRAERAENEEGGAEEEEEEMEEGRGRGRGRR